MATDTSVEPLHHLISDAHHSVLKHDGYGKALPLIDSIIARLQRAKIAYLAGDTVKASREFDPNYEVT